MVLSRSLLIGTFLAACGLPAHATEAASVWAGRPVAAFAPGGFDRQSLNRHFENAAAPTAGAEAAPPAPPGAAAGRPRSVRFNGVLLPRVSFSDARSVTESLVKAIDNTKASLRLVLYDFNQPLVLAAIQRAVERTPPVQIQLLLDSSHSFPSNGRPPSPELQALLADKRLDTRILRGLDEFGTMHNKFAIFDDRMVEYGSYNWTKAAESKNYENALFSTEARQVGLYYGYFEWMWRRSSPPTGPAAPPELDERPPTDRSPTVRFNGKLLPMAVFSPEGGSVEWLKTAIGASEKTIDVAMFSFYEQSLADALVGRRDQGVAIRVLLDKDQATRSLAVRSLRDRGMEIRLSKGRTPQFSVMHNKFAIFDGKLLETGSFNWTNNGEHNSFENLSFLTDAGDVSEFQAAFERIWANATPIDTLPETAWLTPVPGTSLR